MSEPFAGTFSDTAPSLNGAVDLVTRAAKQGATDAEQAAKRVWASTELFVSRFVYTTCYTVSYGVVFSSTLLTRSIPKNNAAVRGFIAGSADAVQKVDRIKGLSIPDPSAA